MSDSVKTYWSPVAPVDVTEQYNWTNNHTFSGTITTTGGFNANGSLGTAYQVLTSDGTKSYWSSLPAVNVAAQYVWTNAHSFAGIATFANTATFTGVTSLAGINANGSLGNAGQRLTSNGTAVYWDSVAGVNTAADYAWTGDHSFTGTVTANGIYVFNGPIAIASSITANGSTGSNGQVLKNDGTKVYWGAAGAGITFSNSAMAPLSPVISDEWYDTSNDILYKYVTDGTSSFWMDISSAPTSFANISVSGSISANGTVGTNGQVLTSNGTVTYWANSTGGGTTATSVRQVYTGTGSANVFTVAGGYTPGNLDVYLNGVKLESGIDVNITSGATFAILTTVPAVGDTIEVVGSSATAGPYLSTVGGSVTGDISISGNTTVAAISANGTIGSAGQVLASDGTKSYWSNVVLSAAGSTNGQVIISNGSVAAWGTIPGVTPTQFSVGFANALPNTGMVDNDTYYANNTTKTYTFEATSNTWVQTGAAKVAGLSDVTVTTPANGDRLAYQSNTSTWVNATRVDAADKILFPSTHQTYGRVFARGKTFWMAGGSAGAGRITWFGRGGDSGVAVTDSTRSFPVAPHTAIDAGTSFSSWKKFVVSMSALHAITEDGRLYSMGRDDEGQMGSNETEGANTYRKAPYINISPKLWSANGSIKVTDIFGTRLDDEGVNHGAFFVVVLDNGVYKNYSFGDNNSGQLGIGSTSNRGEPVLITAFPAGKRIVKLDQVIDSTVAVLDDGTVWGAGYNGTGNLGTGLPTNTTVTNPETTFKQAKLSNGTAVTGAADVKMAWSYGTGVTTYILLSNGQVLSSGFNADGMLGSGSTPTAVPGQVGRNFFGNVLIGAGTNLTNITKIDANYTFLMALDSTGNIWHVGRNSSGVRGDGSAAEQVTGFATICQNNMKDFWLMSGHRGFTYVFFLKNDNQLLSAGYNIHGSLGIWWTPGVGSNNVAHYVYLDGDEYAVDIKPCGQVSDSGVSYNGAMILTNKNRVWVCGRNGSCLGMYGYDDSIHRPALITDITPTYA
jgi:alpha-tubulin suppressor-like RCC1 family protein